MEMHPVRDDCDCPVCTYARQMTEQITQIAKSMGIEVTKVDFMLFPIEEEPLNIKRAKAAKWN